MQPHSHHPQKLYRRPYSRDSGRGYTWLLNHKRHVHLALPGPRCYTLIKAMDHLLYAEIIFLYYFNDLAGSVLTAAVFCIGTMAGAVVSTHLSEIWYGIGLTAGSFLGWTTAYFRLRFLERNLDVHIFCNGHLLKHGRGSMPSSKVFDRYKE